MKKLPITILCLGDRPAWGDWLCEQGFQVYYEPQNLSSDLTLWNLGENDSSRLNEWTSPNPLVVIGATADRRGASAAARALACDYVLKTLAPRELLKAIQEALQSSQKLAQADRDLRTLAKIKHTAASPHPVPRVSHARQTALRSFFLLLRAQVVPMLTAWTLWRRLLILEKVYLHGHCHPVPDDPAAYLLLTLDILALPASPSQRLDARTDTDSPQCEAYRRLHNRIEQRKLEESHLLLAGPLWLRRSRLPASFQERFEQCWV